MSQLQNYSVTPLPDANITNVPRWQVSADVYDDVGTLLGNFAFNWPDIIKNMTAAHRQRLVEHLAPAILRARAGLDPEL